MDSLLEPKRIERVVLACVQCRNRHVKCDSTQPICNRCSRDGKDCTYKKSRRGGLDKAALVRRRERLQEEAERTRQTQDVSRSNSDFDTRSSTQSPAPGYQGSFDDADGNQATDTTRISDTQIAFQASEHRLLELFFENFWPSFPVVIPIHFLQVRRLNRTHGMSALLPVLCWIGSIYTPCMPSEPYFQAAIAAVGISSLEQTAFNVQALMLYAVALYHSDIRREARNKLDQAIAMAVELRMNEKEFARAYGEGNPVLEEAWRRTFYILRLSDQNFAIVNNIPIYTLLTVPNRVDLPCDDEYFESGQIPPAIPMVEYENREFAEVEVVYSSLTYLYDMAMIVTHTMSGFIESGSFVESIVDSCDTKVAIWSSLLPTCKKDPLRPDGKVDEVMFMAHMLAAVTLSTTHRPFSSLPYSPAELSTESFLAPAPFMVPIKGGRMAHTIRTLKAGEAHIKLLSIPCAIERHNIFTMCMSAQLAAVQISACVNIFGAHQQSVARDSIKLILGFLSTMGSSWPLGKKMAMDIRTVARSDLPSLQNSVTTDSRPITTIDSTHDTAMWLVDPVYTGIMLHTDLHITEFNDSHSTS